MIITTLPTDKKTLRPYHPEVPPVVIDAEICTGCRLCTHACPQSVLKIIPNIHRVEGVVAIVHNPALCTACRQCEDVCPDFCITVLVDTG